MTSTSLLDHPLIDENRATRIRIWLADRAKRHQHPPDTEFQAAKEVGLLHDLLAAELRQQTWTLAQVGMLAAAVHGVAPLFGAIAVDKPLIWHDVRDSLHDHDDGEVESNHEEVGLLDRLADLGPTAEHALVDAVSRWLAEKHEHSVGGWAQVGIQVTAPAEANAPR